MTNRQEILNETDIIEHLSFEGIEKTYTRVVLLNTALTYIIMMVIPPIILFLDNTEFNTTIVIIAEIIFIAAAVINLIVASKSCKYMGYALRERDITYRKGVFFHNITTIPFCKVQQVSINQNPIARLFGLYSIEISNGSAWQSSLTIPGLTQKRAETLKQHITNKLNDAAK